MTKAADTREFIATAKKFSSQFGALLKAADLLEGIVSFQQATDEAKAELAKVRADLAEKYALQKEIADLRKERDELRAHRAEFMRQIGAR
jgi:uncharacterized protein involved in exopolysaccharide biosynthesis